MPVLTDVRGAIGPGRASAVASKLEAFTRLSADDKAALAAICRNVRVIDARRDLISEGDSGYSLPAREAEATARWTRAVLDGEVAAPVALARQAALVVDHCRREGGAARQPLRLVSSK